MTNESPYVIHRKLHKIGNNPDYFFNHKTADWVTELTVDCLFKQSWEAAACCSICGLYSDSTETVTVRPADPFLPNDRLTNT